MRHRILLPTVLAIMVGGLATQSIGQSVVIERAAAAPARQEGIVRVQLSVQLFIAAPTDESDEAERLRERSRRLLYQMAAKECDVMRDVMARDCRLEAVNVNLHRQPNPQMSGYQVMGNMTYQITLK